MSLYRQCLLRRPTDLPTTYWIMIEWLPAKLAVLGTVLHNGYTVAEVWGSLDESQLPDLHKQHRAHRKATGDSLPKPKPEELAS